jgi:hypothetical protein
MTGNDDMSNGNGSDVNRIYTDALTAQLGERVTNLNRRQSDLESEMRSGFKQIESSMTALSSEMRSSVAALSANLAERSRPQWQALGVALTFAAMLGGLAYLPVREATSDLKGAVAMLSERMVTQKEMEWRTARGAEDRKRTDEAIIDLRANAVSRNEWSERNHARDGEIAELGRRINEIRQDVGSQYTTRDVLLSTQSEVKDLRNQLRRLYEARLGGSDLTREVSP